MIRRKSTWHARLLLVAAAIFVCETSCSHAPSPDSSSAPEQGIARILTRDGTLYVSSCYAVQDSVVVIEEILRDRKYYPDDNEPHLYQRPEPVRQPPADIEPPVVLSLSEIDSIEPWQTSNKTSHGIAALPVIIVMVAMLVGIAASQVRIGAD